MTSPATRPNSMSPDAVFTSDLAADRGDAHVAARGANLRVPVDRLDLDVARGGVEVERSEPAPHLRARGGDVHVGLGPVRAHDADVVLDVLEAEELARLDHDVPAALGDLQPLGIAAFDSTSTDRLGRCRRSRSRCGRRRSRPGASAARAWRTRTSLPPPPFQRAPPRRGRGAPRARPARVDPFVHVVPLGVVTEQSGDVSHRSSFQLRP